MLGPDIVDVASRVPVAPAAGRFSADTSALAGQLTVRGDMTAASSVIPEGLVRVANRAVAKMSTNSESGAVVVTDGAVIACPVIDDRPPDAWIGELAETPE